MWIVDIPVTIILIIFKMFCSHATVILMTQCSQVYSDTYNIILFCIYMCYIPHSICDGSDICCMYYFNPDLRKIGPIYQDKITDYNCGGINKTKLIFLFIVGHL